MSERTEHVSSRGKTVEVVIPIYNESDCLDELFSRLRRALDAAVVSVQVTFVENGSTDDSRRKLRAFCATDRRFSTLILLRNFGMEGGVMAGVSRSSADAVITMQGDLEDPPELINQMITEWLDGSRLVYGEVLSRGKLSLMRTLLTKAYYKLASKMSGGAIIENASDFRLMDRQVYRLVVELADQNLFMRSLVNWAGVRSTAVPFVRGERVGGTSKFRTRAAVGFAFRGILTQTVRPLRWLAVIGFLAMLASIAGIAILAVVAFTTGFPFAGFGTLVGLQCLLFGIVMLSLGLISEYLVFIYKEVRPRPLFVVDEASEPEQ